MKYWVSNYLRQSAEHLADFSRLILILVIGTLMLGCVRNDDKPGDISGNLKNHLLRPHTEEHIQIGRLKIRVPANLNYYVFSPGKALPKRVDDLCYSINKEAILSSNAIVYEEFPRVQGLKFVDVCVSKVPEDLLIELKLPLDNLTSMAGLDPNLNIKNSFGRWISTELRTPSKNYPAYVNCNESTCCYGAFEIIPGVAVYYSFYDLSAFPKVYEKVLASINDFLILDK